MIRRAVLVAGLVGAGVLAVSAPAVAHRSGDPIPTIRHLRAQVRALHARVEILTGERNALRASLRGATLRRTRSKRGLAVLTPLGVAVAQVRHEVYWAQGARKARLGGQLVGEAAMDYAVGHVSTGEYGYLELLFGQPAGGPALPSYQESVNTILITQAGICVQAEHTFAAIVHALGFKVRDIGFEYLDPDGTPDSHSAAEVYYDGAWHFFDPTFGQFWTSGSGSVLSIADVRTLGGLEHRDDASFTNLIEDAEVPAGGDTWFETAPSTSVFWVDRKGTRHDLP